MGREILYCALCQSQLRGSDFDKGSAVRLGTEGYCRACVPQALKTLPQDKVDALVKVLSAAQDTPKTDPPPETRRTAVPEARTPRRALPRARAGSPVWVMGVAGAVVVALLLAVLAFSGRPTDPPKTERRPTADTVAEIPEPAPVPPAAPAPRPAPAPARPPDAQASLDQAREAVRARPQDLDGHLKAYEQAVWDARGTPLEEVARRELDGIAKTLAARSAGDLAALDLETRSHVEREEFRRALDVLEQARGRRSTPDWATALESRARAIREKPGTLFAALRDAALDAQRRGAAEDVAAAKARVARWGLGTFTAELDQALAGATAKPPPPPAPPAASEAETYRRAWDVALDLASVRDAAGAAAALAGSANGLQDKTLAAEAAVDAELLRAVAALHAEARQALVDASKGRKLAISFYDYDARLHREEGAEVRYAQHQVLIRRDSRVDKVPEGELRVRSLVDLARGRGRVDPRVAALACLVEGDVAGARELAGSAELPERFWRWGSEIERRWADPEHRTKETEVKYAYYMATMAAGSPLFEAESALRCRTILEEQGRWPWVRRNRARLALVAEGGKDYVAGVDELRAGGAFRLETRTWTAWTCAEDGKGESFVEMDFSVRPGLPYRAWAFVGGCCAEVLAFHAQGADEPVKHGLLSSTRTHASHGGRKQPSRWAWVEIPLPAYGTAGPQTLRLSTSHQGFSVAAMVVSAVRDKPPGEPELKEAQKKLPRAMGPLGPTLGLAAWFRADAGVAHQNSRVTHWVDQSGRDVGAVAPHAAGRPAWVSSGLNGKPVLRFDGAQSSLNFELPVEGLNAMTLIVVAAPSRDIRSFDFGRHAALHWREHGPWGGVFVSPQQAAVLWRFGTSQGGNMPMWNRPGGASGAPVLVTARKDALKEDLFVQGALVSSVADRRAPISHTPGLAAIGAGASSATEPYSYFAGDIAEILVYTRALPDAERDAVERHLRAKYGF
ncbi:MAG TPA: hypothetical protein VEJ18_09555 [Planctomycetota bacterium]|nr:hypothetical protein [Planctomycetota bacterium]